MRLRTSYIELMLALVAGLLVGILIGEVDRDLTARNQHVWVRDAGGRGGNATVIGEGSYAIGGAGSYAIGGAGGSGGTAP